MTQRSILVVDDEQELRTLLHRLLESAGYGVALAATVQEALDILRDVPVEIVLTDLRLPDTEGLAMLEQVSRIDPRISTIVMTGYGSVDVAVTAMKAGAFDFIAKPFDPEAVLLVVKKAVEFQRLRRENLQLKKAVREQYGLEQFIGTSEAVRALLEFIEKVADTDSTILIEGESGTGKELMARMLHFNSARRDHSFLPVNCGAIPDTLLESELFGHEKGAFTGAHSARMGRFELAHGGTIFLDEVAEMNQALQVKLLRVVQERCFERVGGRKTIEVDVRIIAATNQNLEQAVRERRFRKDLFYRLHVIPVTMPPLRERRSDIPLLVEHFIDRLNRAKHTSVQGPDAEALGQLMQYQWPGNIRELENLIERLVVLKKTGPITWADLPEKIARAVAAPASSMEPSEHWGRNGINLLQELERHESELIMAALRQSNGVTSRAAKLLRVNRTTLVEKLKRKGLGVKP